jgi:uncharacterized protein (TIGR03435 family)
MRHLHVLLSGVVVLTLNAPVGLRGQADDKFAFDVASVKPNSVTNAPAGARVLPSGHVTATNMAVRAIIGTAWGSDAIQMSSQIVCGPSWIDTDHYDINAKASTGFSDKDGAQGFQRLQAMLRALLADRFQARVHTEMRDVPIYTLVLASKDGKLGPRLLESHANCYNAASPPPRAAMYSGRRLFQLDGYSVGGLPRGILLCVRRRASHAHVVRLRTFLIVQVQNDAIQNVLVPLPLVVRLEVNPQDSDLIIF